MTDVPEVHDETRTKIVILAAGTVLWLLLQIVINFITDLAKLTFVAVVLYLLYLAGEGRLCGWDDFEVARVQGVEFICQVWSKLVGTGGE